MWYSQFSLLKPLVKTYVNVSLNVNTPIMEMRRMLCSSEMGCDIDICKKYHLLCSRVCYDM